MTDLPKEQIEQLKKQVLEQINSTFPEDKKEEAINQINTMDDKAFIEFLKQNNLINPTGSSPQQQGKCVFCSIVFGEMPSTKIGENSKAIAILEINPISKGHTLIIPKNHLDSPEKLEKEVFDLANEIIEKIQITFSPKEVQLIPGNVMGHQIINLLPVYNNETINSPKTNKTPEDLQKLKEQIDSSKKEEPKHSELEEKSETTNPIAELDEKNIWLPKRIP